jgi:multidrug resistance efflux pump
MLRFFLFVVTGVLAVAGLGALIADQSQTQVALASKAESELDCPSAAIYAPGRVEGANQETEIRPHALGRVVEVLACEGQWVEQGAVLFRLDDLLIRQELLLAKAELVQTEGELLRLENGARASERDEAAALHRAKVAELNQAQQSLERLENLRHDAVARQEVDDYRTRVAALAAQADAAKARADLLSAPARSDEMEIALAKVAAARAKVGLVEVQLDRMTVRAPCAGQILAVETVPGECVDPQMSQAPLIMADTRRLRVRAFVEEFDAPNIEIGMRAEVTADGLSGRLAGRITHAHVSPRMTTKEVWSDRPSERHDAKAREVLIDLDGASNLVIGLRVDVMIDAAEIAPGAPSSDPVSAAQLSAAMAGNSFSQ